jgi:hypothetical protein
MFVAPAPGAGASSDERAGRAAIAGRSVNRAARTSLRSENLQRQDRRSRPAPFPIEIDAVDPELREQRAQLPQRAVMPRQERADRLFVEV